MDKWSQNKNECELTVIKTEQFLLQERSISESSFDISDQKNLVTLTEQESETEWFYIKIIKKIRYKNMILKIVTFGCLNNLIEEKTNNEVKPWLDKLTIIQEKNKEEMWITNQRIVEAEELIIENSKKSYINKIVIKQQINNELFYDALDNQPWLAMKTVTYHSI